jgi:hypothetical protein
MKEWSFIRGISQILAQPFSGQFNLTLWSILTKSKFFVFGYNNCLMEPNIEIVFVKKWSL